jgi:hypothetical protein
MKKIIMTLVIALCTTGAFAADPVVDEKVLEAFNKTFKNPKNVIWTTHEYSYEVRFEQNSITARVTYDLDGNIVKTFRYYKEEALPVLVMSRVKNKFPEKKIYFVVEESSDQGTWYHITLEDDKNWVEIKADSYGSMTVQKKFKKA